MRYLQNVEPAALTGFAASLFPILLMLGLDVPEEAKKATLVALPLILGGIQAALTRPMKVPAMVQGVSALLTALAAWGVTLPNPELLPLLSASLLNLASLLVRMGVVPNRGIADEEVALFYKR